MNDWKEYKIEDIAEVQTGPFGSQLHMKDYASTGTPIITVEHLGENKVIHENLPLVTDADKARLKKYTLAEGDIVFSRVGSVDRRAYISKKEDGWMFSGRLLRVRCNKNVVNPKFLSYYFGQETFKEYIRQIAVGATMPSINTTILSEVELSIPPLTTQTIIANHLSILDDKIDLLTHQNRTLEQLAETYFRQWFVEMAEDSWEEYELKSLFNISIGRTPPRKENEWFTTSSNDVSWISIRDMGMVNVYIAKTAEFLTKHAVERFNIPVIPPNTVILSFKLTVGRVAITLYEMLSNEAIAHFRIKNDSAFSSEFLYLLLKTYPYETLGSTSSIAEAINSTTIKEIKLNKPPDDLLVNFKKLIQPYFQKIKSNVEQIQKLEGLRDNLLPKLMSGEIILNNL